MPIEIDRDESRRLVAEGAQLVEVLPSPEYEEEHLPGAIHIPLKKINGFRKGIRVSERQAGLDGRRATRRRN